MSSPRGIKTLELFRLRIYIAGQNDKHLLDVDIQSGDPALVILLGGRLIDVLDSMEHHPEVEVLDA